MLQSQYPDTGFYLPAESAELAEKWAMIPVNVDLLVTHTPPYGACDVERGALFHEKPSPPLTLAAQGREWRIGTARTVRVSPSGQRFNRGFDRGTLPIAC